MLNKNKYITITLIVASMASVAMATPKINLSGDASADIGIYYDSTFDYKTMVNHDISVDLGVEINEGVSFNITGTTYSTTINEDGDREKSELRRRDAGAVINDEESMYSEFELDSYSFNWNFTENGTLMFGDLIYNAGATSYHGFSNSSKNAAIIPDQRIRGIGIHASDLKVYFGSPVNSNDFGISAYASYTYKVFDKADQKLALSAIGDFILSGSDRFNRGTLGIEADYSQTIDKFAYGIYFAGAILNQTKGNNTFTILAEPSLNYKKASLSLVAYHAFLPYLPSEKDVADQAYMPEQQFFVLEPGVQLHRLIAVGIPLEYHNESVKQDDDDYFRAGFNTYLYPTSNAEFVFWGAYDMMNYDSNNLWSMGLAANLSF